MHRNLQNEIHQRYQKWVTEQPQYLSAIHEQFLAIRQTGLTRLAAALSDDLARIGARTKNKPSILFDHGWLENFATGDISLSLGAPFAIYSNRRCPRIPNGQFLLMSRIMEIQATQGVFDQPTNITAEYDVSENPWFMSEASQNECPLSILIEIALQPCGVLSAWLETPLRHPEINYFFRNLDGEVEFLYNLDLRGKTIKTRATLKQTTFTGSVIIQHFDFSLLADDQIFMKGTSSFGYFPEETMAAQVGLDHGKPSLPWGGLPENISKMQPVRPCPWMNSPELENNPMLFLDQARICHSGGLHSKGYVFGFRENSPADWFYQNHFHQDPVMPGSLGIEAAIQALKTLIHHKHDLNGFAERAEKSTLNWQYRGQVLPDHQDLWVEVHIKNQELVQNKHRYTADAYLWAENIRIYAINNLTLQCQV